MNYFFHFNIYFLRQSSTYWYVVNILLGTLYLLPVCHGWCLWSLQYLLPIWVIGRESALRLLITELTFGYIVLYSSMTLGLYIQQTSKTFLCLHISKPSFLWLAVAGKSTNLVISCLFKLFSPIRIHFSKSSVQSSKYVHSSDHYLGPK